MTKLYKALLLCSVATLTSQAKTEYTKHTIKSGESLYTIAHKYHVSMKELYTINGIEKGEILKIGRELKVPNVTLAKKIVHHNKEEKSTLIENEKTHTVTSVKKKKEASFEYTIKSGESLYTIAKKYHTTVEILCSMNNLKIGKVLKVGRKIKVPGNMAIAAKDMPKKDQKAKKIPYVKHTIKSGESLYTIAKQNHTTIEVLCTLNDMKIEEALKIGRKIKVPKTVTATTKTTKKERVVHYIVQKGDTLSTIAHKNHITIAALRDRNHLKKDDVIKVGQTLALAPHQSTNSKEKHIAKVSHKEIYKKSTKSTSKSVKRFTLNDLVFGSELFRGKVSKKSQRMIEIAKQKLGKRYVWGAVGQKNTFDCSGLTTYVCKANGIRIPRRAIEQSKVGQPVKRSELQPGDLIFFDTSKHRKGYVNHVGIYIGHGKFIHASSAKKKVIITSLKKPFYSQRFKGARRVTSL